MAGRFIMPSTKEISSCSTVQGSSLLFSQNNYRSNSLSVKILKGRSLTLDNCHGCFIENTNFNKLPPNCCGLLIAFRLKQKHLLEIKQWSLGIIMHLHPQETVIAPCVYKRSGYTVQSEKYILSDKIQTYKPYSVQNDDLQIVYLNCLDNTSLIGTDGYIESSIHGPDVPYNYKLYPTDVFRKAYDLVSRRVTSLFSLSTPK